MLTYEFELFFVFVGSHIIHSTQLIELAQSQATFAKIAQLWLAIVLCCILIHFRLFFPKFLQQHKDIYTGAGAAAPGTPGAGAPAVVGAAPGIFGCI